MKKFILSIALAALSFGAYAGGYASSTSATATVGGVVGAYSGPQNGYAPSGVSMRSSANAFSGASGYSYNHSTGHYHRNRCYSYYHQTGIGSHTGASVYGGADISVSGSSYGDAGGYNYADATYDATASEYADRNWLGLRTSASSNASTDGWAFGRIDLDGNQSGSVDQSVESGAYNYSKSHAEYGKYNSIDVDGRTYGKTWVFTDGSRSQSEPGPGLAYGESGGNAYQSGSAASRGYILGGKAFGTADLSGSSHALSKNNNVGGSWGYGDLGYDASATRRFGYSAASASDWKTAKADSWGHPTKPHWGFGESVVNGSVSATGTAGRSTQTAATPQ